MDVLDKGKAIIFIGNWSVITLKAPRIKFGK